MKKLFGGTDLEDALKRLDKLTHEEARMATAELLKVTRGVAQDVVGIDNRVAGVDDRVADVDNKLASVDNRVRGVDATMSTVDDRVKAVDEKVAVVIRGAQTMLSHSLTKNNPESLRWK